MVYGRCSREQAAVAAWSGPRGQRVVGEHQRVLARGVQRGEGFLKVNGAHVAGVGFGLPALSPSRLSEMRGASAVEGVAIYGPLS